VIGKCRRTFGTVVVSVPGSRWVDCRRSNGVGILGSRSLDPRLMRGEAVVDDTVVFDLRSRWITTDCGRLGGQVASSVVSAIHSRLRVDRGRSCGGGSVFVSGPR